MRDLEAEKVDSAVNKLSSLTDVSVPAPTNGQVLEYITADGRWEAVTPAAGGNVTFSTTEAFRPAGAEGDLFLPTDGYHVERKGASVYSPWGPVWPFTPPVDGDYAWINQDGSSVDATRGGIYLEHPAASTGTSASLRVKTAPATPYTITTYLRPNFQFAKPFLMAGLLFRESSTGKLVTMHVNDGFMWVTKWASATAITADYFQTDALVGMPEWLRIADDGTLLRFSISRNGYNWTEFFSVSRTNFLALGPNQTGFFVNAQNNATPNHPCGALLLSWKEA